MLQRNERDSHPSGTIPTPLVILYNKATQTRSTLGAEMSLENGEGGVHLWILSASVRNAPCLSASDVSTSVRNASCLSASVRNAPCLSASDVSTSVRNASDLS